MTDFASKMLARWELFIISAFVLFRSVKKCVFIFAYETNFGDCLWATKF
jgi:hypothetical protein